MRARLLLIRMMTGLLLTVPCSGRADDETARPDDTVRVDEVVVTGSKTEEDRWEATVPVQVLDRAEVESSSTINLEDALAEIPGLYVRRNNQFRLGASTVRMQGADPDKVAILVDGRRVRGGIEGVVDLRDLPANNVERIEIIRGPASSLYGSDAMAGVINIITRGGTPEPHAAAAYGQGSFARKFWSASHGWQAGNLRYFFSGMHDEFRPLEQYGVISEQFTGDEVQKRDQAGARFDWEHGAHRVSLTPSIATEDSPDSDKQDLSTGGEWQWRTSENTRITNWINWYDFTRSNNLEGFEENNHYDDWEGESRFAFLDVAAKLLPSLVGRDGTRLNAASPALNDGQNPIAGGIVPEARVGLVDGTLLVDSAEQQFTP